MEHIFSIELATKIVSSQEEFPVDFNELWQWCGYSRKSKAKEKLTKHFERDLDYCTKKCNQPSTNASGFVQVEILKLTLDAAKEFAMMAGTDQGKEVRKYFIAAEKKARELIQNLSPAELILKQAQMLVYLEHKQKQIEAEQKAIKLQQEEAEKERKLLSAQQESVMERQSHVEAELERIDLPTGDYFTVMGYANYIGYHPLSSTEASKIGRKCSKYCRRQGITIEKVSDSRFGTVHSYPVEVLDQFISTE